MENYYCWYLHPSNWGGDTLVIPGAIRSRYRLHSRGLLTLPHPDIQLGCFQEDAAIESAPGGFEAARRSPNMRKEMRT